MLPTAFTFIRLLRMEGWHFFDFLVRHRPGHVPHPGLRVVAPLTVVNAASSWTRVSLRCPPRDRV